MDWEGKVEAAKLTCAGSGETLLPGTSFFSALRFKDGQFSRLDYAPAAWVAVDQAEFISWWRQKTPDQDANPVRTIDREALVHIFAALKGSTERPKQCFLFVVALFLVRVRKLRYLDTVRDGQQSFLLVEDRGQHLIHRIRDPGMTKDEERAVQDNLMEVIELGASADPDTASLP
jgi:hypothetical protein